jgi:hypothetical protein
MVGGEREASGGCAFPGDGAGDADGAACAAETVAAGTEEVETETCA